MVKLFFSNPENKKTAQKQKKKQGKGEIEFFARG